MDITKAEQKKLAWKSKKFGICEAILWDGKLMSFEFYKDGASRQSGIWTDNIEYLKELHKNLGELLEYIVD